MTMVSTHHRVVALPINGFHSDIIQPLSLRAPEVILGCEWDTSVDIWNLGCLVSHRSSSLCYSFLPEWCPF